MSPQQVWNLSVITYNRNHDCSLILLLISDMPQAWEAGLTYKERQAFEIIYGEARVREKIYGRMIKLILTSKAPGTISSYAAAIDKWVKFCDRNGFRKFPPEHHDFALYVTSLSETNTPYSSYKLINAAFPFYYAAHNSNEVCVTKLPFIKLLLDSAMRKAAKVRKPVKKAATFSEENIKSLLRTIFWPQGSENFPSTNLKNWRTAIRLYSYYMTLCRYDCFSKLTVSSITFHDDHLVVSYPSRKNDQLYSGSTSILKYRPNDLLCPRLVFQTYFRIMKLSEPKDILNCRLSRNGKEARPNMKLSYSQSLQDSKKLLEQFGITDVSEKSFKASGVTVLLDKKTPIVDVQIFGGWKSEQTPMFYHNSSISRRMDISMAL